MKKTIATIDREGVLRLRNVPWALFFRLPLVIESEKVGIFLLNTCFSPPWEDGETPHPFGLGSSRPLLPPSHVRFMGRRVRHFSCYHWPFSGSFFVLTGAMMWALPQRDEGYLPSQ